MPFPSSSVDLMATAMGGSLAASAGVNPAPSNGLAASSPSSASPASASRQTSTSIRIFYSLKENPNAIISYTDLVRKEQKRQQRMTDLQASVSKTGGNAASAGPNASSTQPTSLGPLKNQKVTGTGPLGTSSTGNNAGKETSSTAMDIDPPEGEEALGDGDSEAEDDDEADEDDDENENEEDGEAEDEDDDEDDDEEEDDPETGRREPRDFLDSLTEKYAGLEENGNDGEDEDEDEDEDGKSQVLKRPSRWDTEHYDIEDEFIDDSEMMLEAIGMVRPKVDGFFAYRGPVETTTEDPDSSDAGLRSRKPARRKPATGSSPLSTGRGGAPKTGKGSSLSVMENANDSTSEMSEMDDKPRPSKAPTGTSSLANSSTLSADNPTTGGEGAGNSATTTPTKKKSSPSKGKVAAKDIAKETESAKDSDKESKPGVAKKPKAKPTKAALSGAPTTASLSATPIVRVDSPPPADDTVGNSTPPPAPSRSTSPAKSKTKGKTTVDPGSSATATVPTSDPTAVATSTSETGTSASASKSATKSNTSEGSSKTKSPKALEPMNREVQAAYDVVAELAKKETWEVKTKFPPHIKTPLFECARLALATRSSGYVLEDYFFTHLQAVLPYNKFTLKKLIYKNVLPGWIADLEAQKTRLIEQFTTRANMVWRASGLAQQETSQPSEKDVDGDVNMNGEDGKPQKKFPWSQDLRLLLWETMEKFMEILAAKQEYRAIDESQPAPPSDSKTRKDAYQTLLLSFPAGWMTSYEISRQYSQLKEKVQKQEKREVESSSTSAPTGKIKPVFSINSGPRSGSTANTSRNTTGQSGSTTTSTEKKLTVSVPPAATSASTTTPASSTVTEHTLNASAPVSNEVVKEATQRSSPTISPSNLSEILHPSPHTPQQQQQSPRIQNPSFIAGPASVAVSSKKRKKTEEVQPLGSGSSHNPVVLTELATERKDASMHPQGYYRNGDPSEYAPASLSPSAATSNPNYSAPQDGDAIKKKKGAAVARGGGNAMPSQAHSNTTYHQGTRESMYQQSHSSPPQPALSHAYSPPSGAAHAQPQLHHAHSRGYSSAHQHQHQHQQVPPQHHHFQHPQHPHHDQAPQQQMHRVTSPGGGGGSYPPASSLSPSRALPPPAHLQSLGPPPSSAPKAMSMSNLLHPHPR